MCVCGWPCVCHGAHAGAHPDCPGLDAMTQYWVVTRTCRLLDLVDGLLEAWRLRTWWGPPAQVPRGYLERSLDCISAVPGLLPKRSPTRSAWPCKPVGRRLMRSRWRRCRRRTGTPSARRACRLGSGTSTGACSCRSSRPRPVAVVRVPAPSRRRATSPRGAERRRLRPMMRQVPQNHCGGKQG